MTLRELIKQIEGLNDEQKLSLGKENTKKYYNFCQEMTDDEFKCKTLFFGSIATIIGIDLVADMDEFNFFQKLMGETDLTYDDFCLYVKSWTNVKTIKDTDQLIDDYASLEVKYAFSVICVLFSLSNQKLDDAEYALIVKYLK